MKNCHQFVKYTQAVAYTTYFGLGEPACSLAEPSEGSATSFPGVVVSMSRLPACGLYYNLVPRPRYIIRGITMQLVTSFSFVLVLLKVTNNYARLIKVCVFFLLRAPPLSRTTTPGALLCLSWSLDR